jgi:hypothetical protein
MLRQNKGKLDLLEISEAERTRLIKEIREGLRQKVMEARTQQPCRKLAV